MTHKLLITLKMTKPSKYKEFLSEFETVSGETTALKVMTKNIGDKPTPEGEITVTMDKPSGTSTFRFSIRPLKMRALKPNEECTVGGEEVFLEPGLWAVTAVVKINDNEQIEYHYQKREKGSLMAPHPERWMMPIYVVDKRNLDLQLLIMKLIETKEK